MNDDDQTFKEPGALARLLLLVGDVIWKFIPIAAILVVLSWLFGWPWEF